MADDSSSRDDRTQRFDVVRKGYDRQQVESFLADSLARIEKLEGELDDVSQAALAIGVDDPEALARELSAIGGEVGNILEAARSAAEGLRSRAATDARKWTTAAESDATTMIAEATEQMHSMRASAWNEGSSMLQSASAEAKKSIAESKEDALFIKAEAEREAIRHTGDAKRDREETIRSARLEAEQVLAKARDESDGLLHAANQAAELAQERARALESRRSELLSELEAAKSSIGQLETEIESKRQALETPVEPEVPEEDPARSHHTTDGGSVRIVSATKSVSLTPVDADSFVAEVVALRSSSVQADEDQDGSSKEEPIAPVPPIPDPPVVAVAPEPKPEPKPEPAPAPEPAAATPSDDQPVPDVADTAPELVQVAEPASSENGPAVADEIGSLFAQLKETTHDAARSSSPVAEVEIKAAGDVPEEPRSEAPEPSLPTDPGMSLIPMRNDALREIKRSLVDLQNDTLEHLRTDEDWLPEKNYTAKFAGSFKELADAIDVNDDDGTEAASFEEDLLEALVGAIERSRSAGSGGRAVAAAASKVFRTWRSDEAERRVVASATLFASATTV